MKKAQSRRPKERGVIYVFFAMALGTILLLMALAVGMGFLASNRSRLQSIANLATLAAISEFINSDGEDDARQALALDRTNLILGHNRLHGTSRPLGGVSLDEDPDSGGQLHFGRHLRQAPVGGGTPCHRYPCFTTQLGNGAVNAVHLTLRSSGDNLISNPVRRIIGPETYNLQTNSTATLVNTCLGHLMGVSFSTTALSHRDYVQGGLCFPPNCPADLADLSSAARIIDPTIGGQRIPLRPDVRFSGSSLFAFNADRIFTNAFAMLENAAIPLMRDCTNIAELENPDFFPDLMIWCNLPPSRRSFEAINNPPPNNMFFQSDYELQQVFFGQRPMLVNKHPTQRPRPLLDFMLGANMALRILSDLPAEANRGFFRAFTGNVFGRQFPGVEHNELLVTDLDFMTQITNFEEIGRIDLSQDLVNGRGQPEFASQSHPNLLDFGFFPMNSGRFFTGAPTPPGEIPPWDLAAVNLPLVLFEAARDISDPASRCLEQDRKLLFLYTDGISTCSFNPPAPLFPAGRITASCLPNPHAWNHYTAAEWTILNGLIPYLRARGVAVTVIFSGDAVRPNYRNISDPDFAEPSACQSDTGDPECFLDYNRAQNHGRGGPPAPPNRNSPQPCAADSIYDCSNEVPGETNPSDEETFRSLLDSQPDVIFGRSLGVMGALAARTGGLFCPLMPVGDVADYWDHDGDCPGTGMTACCQGIFDNNPDFRGRSPCVLRNSSRQMGQTERRSLHFIPEALQAAHCAQRALTENPFVLVEPLEINLN